jgi:hypothetical protein
MKETEYVLYAKGFEEISRLLQKYSSHGALAGAL